MNKVILLRFARGLGAVLLAGLAAYIVSDDVLSVVPDQYDFVVVSIVAPALLALDKLIRDGGDANA
jgi:hypothetical protein